MATPILTPDQVVQVSALVAQYITTQREHYARRAIPLERRLKARFDGFFSPALLQAARFIVLTRERVENPSFYPMLRHWGFHNLPDQSAMAAITFCDTVVSHRPSTHDTLFHELVHVEQYPQLGVSKFSELYVRGFLEGGSYDKIPLERNAYTLGARFLMVPISRFSVADEVARWIATDKF